MAAAPARSLTLICLTTGAWAFSFGLGSQVVSHWLNNLDYSNGDIGLVHAAYYLGLAVAAALVPWMMRRWGSACAGLGLGLSGLTLAIFPWSGGLAGWLALRFINGAASAMSLIPLETYVSRVSHPAQRTRNFGFYAVALTLGGALGIFVGHDLYVPGDVLAFCLGGAVPIAAELAFFRWLKWQPDNNEKNTAPVRLRGSRHFLSFGTAWSQGFLEGGMLAFLSLFLLSLGITRPAAGTLMSVTMVGVILFQVPVSWLADRLGSVPVLLGCYAVVLAGLAAVPLLGPSLALTVCLFLLGGCSGAMYPLGLSLLGERLPESSLARAYAWYMAVECVGSQLGAAAMGVARDGWGEAAMFPVGAAALLLVLVPWILLPKTARAECSDGMVEKRSAA
jgi:MFS family permease